MMHFGFSYSNCHYFDLLINSWLSQKFEGAENVNNAATDLFKEDSFLKTTGTELKNNLIEQLKVIFAKLR